MLSKLIRRRRKEDLSFLNAYFPDGNSVFYAISTKPTNPNQNKTQDFFNLCYVNIISFSLAISLKQTPELELYEVVHPKKLHILHKREIQNNQTENGKEVSNVNDSGISQPESQQRDFSLIEVMLNS